MDPSNSEPLEDVHVQVVLNSRSSICLWKAKQRERAGLETLEPRVAATDHVMQSTWTFHIPGKSP